MNMITQRVDDKKALRFVGAGSRSILFAREIARS
jgi:hypothetical protein